MDTWYAIQDPKKNLVEKYRSKKFCSLIIEKMKFFRKKYEARGNISATPSAGFQISLCSIQYKFNYLFWDTMQGTR